MSNYTIRLEEKKDYREVENLVRESFWNVYRPGCSEHYVIHVLRNDPVTGRSGIRRERASFISEVSA